MSRSRALLTLVGLSALFAWGLLSPSNPAATRLPPKGSGDAALFMKVTERLAAGEPYYQALGYEMRRDNYPTRSPFNWRTPLHLTIVAYASLPAATVALKLLTLAAVLATTAVLARFGRTAAIAGTAAQIGALATAFRPEAVVVSDIWAGVFIALSACAYYRAWPSAAAVLGATAVFVRELAAPYCVACAVLSFTSGSRRREPVIWVLAGIAYAGYYGLHVWQVSSHQFPSDLAHIQPWHQWNGLQFTLSTIAVNGWLSFVPRFVTVVYMVLGLAGAAGRSMVPHVRWPLLTYFGLFAVVGLPFNYYWGFVTAPLWAFGIAHAPEGVRRLMTAATRITSPNGGTTESPSSS